MLENTPQNPTEQALPQEALDASVLLLSESPLAPFWEQHKTVVETLATETNSESALEDLRLLEDAIAETDPLFAPYLYSIYTGLDRPDREKVVSNMLALLELAPDVASSYTVALENFPLVIDRSEAVGHRTDIQPDDPFATDIAEQGVVLKEQIERSIKENILTSLVNFGQIAKTGKAQAEIHGKTIEYTSIAEGLEILDDFMWSYGLIAEVVNHSKTHRGQSLQVNPDGEGAWIVTFDNHPRVSLYMRPSTEGNLRPHIEYGKVFSDARIVGPSFNWRVNLSQEDIKNPYAKNEPTFVSQRIDFDFIVPDGKGTDMKKLLLKSSTGGYTKAVLDSGSTLGNPNDKGTRIGLWIGTGDTILSKQKGMDYPRLNHNPRHIGAFLASAEFFRAWVLLSKNYYGTAIDPKEAERQTKIIERSTPRTNSPKRHRSFTDTAQPRQQVRRRPHLRG